MSLFPGFKPWYLVYMSAYLWTLSPWDEPSVTELRLFFSRTDHCILPYLFSFITPFKLLPLLLVAQQYLIAICHSLLAIGASLGSALHPGKFTVA